MIKIRLQGTKKDLRWFLKGLNRDSRYEIDNVSEFKKFKTSDKYHRVNNPASMSRLSGNRKPQIRF